MIWNDKTDDRADGADEIDNLNNPVLNKENPHPFIPSTTSLSLSLSENCRLRGLEARGYSVGNAPRYLGFPGLKVREFPRIFSILEVPGTREHADPGW